MLQHCEKASHCIYGLTLTLYLNSGFNINPKEQFLPAEIHESALLILDYFSVLLPFSSQSKIKIEAKLIFSLMLVLSKFFFGHQSNGKHKETRVSECVF